MDYRPPPFVPVSWGELLDKITILEIKQARIGSAEARANVARELELLRLAAEDVLMQVPGQVTELKAVNEALWEIEDAIRVKEAEGDFGRSFVDLARSVYRQNDRRAALKRQINLKLNSGLIEEKSYASSRPIFFANSAAGG